MTAAHISSNSVFLLPRKTSGHSPPSEEFIRKWLKRVLGIFKRPLSQWTR